MAFKMVFLPPHSERVMAMADEVATAVPEATVVTPESEAEAEREIVDADAAFGTISPRVLSGSSSTVIAPWSVLSRDLICSACHSASRLRRVAMTSR